VKTRQEWAWDDDEEILDRDALDQLLGEVPATRLEPPPAVTAEDVWEWIWREDEEEVLDAELLELDGEASPAVAEETQAQAGGEPRRPKARRRLRHAWGRRVQFLALLAVAALVGAVAPRVTPAVLPGSAGAASGGTAVTAPEQQVVAWTVRPPDVTGAQRLVDTFVAVLAAGARPPVALAVPADVTLNVPGQGVGTIGEAASPATEDLVGVALENLLGVRVDASVRMDPVTLQQAVDVAGGLEVAGQPMDGATVVQYLTAQERDALPDEQFLRWQDVLEGLLSAVSARPEAAAAFPEQLGSVLQAASAERADLYALPVQDLGDGLLVPDQDGLNELVDERFVRMPADVVRLVVLNGVGTPGIGEEVARILVPEGYRLMSSENANTFDLRVTRVIASTEEDVAAAQDARDLLGVGQVLLGYQPAGLTDVTVVVGQDFEEAWGLGGP
jgi:hypothetical protein